MAETIPKTMDALLLLDWNRFEVQKVDTPAPGDMEVLLHVDSVAMCGTDPALAKGAFKDHWGWPPHFPFILGHEYSGVVAQLGNGVKDLQVGDRVAGTSHKGCGYCRNCSMGRYTLCENYGRHDRGHRQYGHNTNGAYAQYMAVSVKSIFKIPPEVSLEEATMVDTASIALHGVKRARMNPGDTVAVIGPGPIGLMALQCARALGAGRAIMVGRGHRLRVAHSLGAEMVDIERDEAVKGVQALTDGKGAHVAIECSGAKEASRQAVDMTRKGGRIVFIAFPHEDVALSIIRIALDELDVLGTRANPNTCAEVIPLMANGAVKAAPLITHRFPLKEFDRALKVFQTREGGVVKIIIKP